MKHRYRSKRLLAVLSFGFLMATGTYNAIVINSESNISSADMRFVKRLDEVYGVVESGRVVATSLQWQKLSLKQAALLKTKNTVAKSVVPTMPKELSQPTPQEVPTQAAVQEDLNLSLTEVINPKKWQQGLGADQFNGNLTTNNGVIESLSVALPNGEGLSVSFSEMTGNVFEYDFEGELYSGMMYQVDQNSYMVTLTNGPLEGTRLKFTGEISLEQQIQNEESQRALAESAESEAGVGTNEALAQENSQEQMPQEQVAYADQNFEQQQQQAQMPPEMIQQYQQQVEQYQNQDAMAQQHGVIEQTQGLPEGYDPMQAQNFEQSQMQGEVPAYNPGFVGT